ncbi:hypothetical protein K449DRAFT_177180 [Hypoxylon sp. EC38]|nr:hypothetical protein K449DRAFT_177180 [Hypoxylon sp. EC38]
MPRPTWMAWTACRQQNFLVGRLLRACPVVGVGTRSSIHIVISDRQRDLGVAAT